MKNVLHTGRPENAAGRLEKEIACYDLLDSLGVSYTRVDHDFADTIESCEAVEQVLGAPDKASSLGMYGYTQRRSCISCPGRESPARAL